MVLSPDTQAILLLTAPLIAGKDGPSAGPLTPGEYKRLARFLREQQRRPADLLGLDARLALRDCPLGTGGLAVVGSRSVEDALSE